MCKKRFPRVARYTEGWLVSSLLGVMNMAEQNARFSGSHVICAFGLCRLWTLQYGMSIHGDAPKLFPYLSTHTRSASKSHSPNLVSISTIHHICRHFLVIPFPSVWCVVWRIIVGWFYFHGWSLHFVFCVDTRHLRHCYYERVWFSIINQNW